MAASTRRWVHPRPGRPLTLAGRRRDVLRAIRILAKVAPDWPLDRGGLGELGEALALLDYVQRQLHD